MCDSKSIILADDVPAELSPEEMRHPDPENVSLLELSPPETRIADKPSLAISIVISVILISFSSTEKMAAPF